MISTDQLAIDLSTWISEQLPDIVGVYPYAPMGKSLGLPDVAVEIERVEVAFTDPRFPMLDIQQAALRIFETVSSMMVLVGKTEEDARAAAGSLRTYTDTLTERILADNTLGGLVTAASPTVSFDFVPQFVRYEDGTRGRQVQMALDVAELIGD